MTKQTVKLWPASTIGKWSIGLIIIMPLLFVLGMSVTGTLYESVRAGSTILADISARPALALTMLAGMAAGTAALITGLLAIIRRKDNALLVYIASLIGALLVIFLIGEILFPH
jgi:hypothetical protein